MGLSIELEACLREFAAAGPAELRENGVRVAPLSALSWEVRGKGDKPLLHLWSDQHNLTRRVLAITDRSEQRLALAVERFGKSKPDRWEFLRAEFERTARDLSRDAFVGTVRGLCEREFPDETVDSLTTAPDLEHSLSGNYVRGVLRRGKQAWAVFVAPDTETDPARCLTFALLWLDRVRNGSHHQDFVAGLRVILPPNAAAAVAHLTAALRPDLCIQLFEREPVMERLNRVDPPAVANFSSWIVPARDVQALLERAHSDLDALLPVNQAYSFHANIAAKEVVVRLRGMAFVRWHESGIWFGDREPKIKWDAAKTSQLRKVVHCLEQSRNPLAADTRHPLYRAQSEKWLEFLVREDVTRIDSALRREFAYSQIVAATAGEHGILDVLSVTRSGRLAILELKTVEHPVFLLQAVKYWLRVRRHLAQGDFARLGYFSGLQLQTVPPLVYLVAPALRFHPATDVLLPYLHPEIEVVRAGIAESWRRGINVVLRQ